MPSKLCKLRNVSKIQLKTYVKCLYALINQLICIINRECLILHREAFRAAYNSRSTKMNDFPVIGHLVMRTGLWDRQGANIASRYKEMYGVEVFLR